MGKKGAIKRALYVAKQRHGYDAGGSPTMDFSDPRYADMYYSGLPLTGVGGILKQFFPDPTKTGAYDAYMKQKSAEYAPKPSVGKTPDFNSTPIQPGTGSSLASMPQFNSQSLGKIPTMQDWAAFNPFQRQAPSSIPPLSQHQFYNGAGAPLYPAKTASAAAPMGETGSVGEDFSTKGDRAYGPMGSESGGFGGFDSDNGGPISSSTSYDNTTNVSQAIESSPLDAPTADTSWAGSLQGARDAFAGPNVGPTAFAEGLTASMPGVGPYGDLSGARSAFAAQQSDEEAAAAAQAEADAAAGVEGAAEGDLGGGYSGNYGGGWGDDSDNQGSDLGGDDSGGWGGGDDGGDSGSSGDGGEGGGDGGGDGGGGDGGGGEKRGGRIYPLRHHTDWEEAHDYEKSGGKLVHMSPDQYLKRVKHLNMDHEDHHIIHHFAKQMEKGEKFDPLAIYPDNHPNGRHRAHAAKKLGIKKVPVVIWPKDKSVKRKSGGPVVDQALMLTSKKAVSRRGRPD